MKLLRRTLLAFLFITLLFCAGDANYLAMLRYRAEQGSANARLKLGEMYLSGRMGVKKDTTEAYKWFHMAAAEEASPEFIIPPETFTETLKLLRSAQKQELLLVRSSLVAAEYDPYVRQVDMSFSISICEKKGSPGLQNKGRNRVAFENWEKNQKLEAEWLRQEAMKQLEKITYADHAMVTAEAHKYAEMGICCYFPPKALSCDDVLRELLPFFSGFEN